MDHDKFPTIFHVDIDAFFASVEESLCPVLKGKPVIVGGLPNERGVVACPNYEARRLGVKTAMPLSQARRIAPNAIFVRGNYEQYEKYSRRFIEILYDFTPAVQAVSLDEAFLNVDGCLHFWNYDPRNLATAIKRAIWEELKITVSIGAASNKLCAKVASDYSKKMSLDVIRGTRATEHGTCSPPDGLLVVPLGEEKNFLSPLPVSALPGIGKRTAEALGSLGIRTVHELADSKPDSLRRICGVVGVYLHDAANGIGSSDLLENEHNAKSISRSTTFSKDSNEVDFISSVFFHLSEKVARSMRKGKLAASTITIKMRYSDGAPMLGGRSKSWSMDRKFVTYQKSHTLEEPTNSEFEIASTAFSLFKSLWLEGIKVRLVGVGVTNIRKECKQLELFQRFPQVRSWSKIRQADLLAGIDRLREKFGYHSVYFGIVNQLDNKYYSDHGAFDLHSSNSLGD